MIVIDQIMRSVEIKSRPRKIVSLVPSLTELLVDMGLETQIVGITKFCIHPKYLKQQCTIIGGTKNVNIEKVNSLSPDLIIANKEENERSQINVLSQLYPVYTTDIINYQDIIQLVHSLVDIFGIDLPNNLIERINSSIPKAIFNYETILYLIWKNPYMSVGNDTFIHQNLSLLNFNNLCYDQKRYPIIELKKIGVPDIIFLSSEPYPFKKSDKEEFKLLFPKSKVILVNGEAFSWYGSRLSKLDNYFTQLRAAVYS